jgi:hypothetical protein
VIGAGVGLAVAALSAWVVGPPVWVVLALHRLGTIARCLRT